MPYIITSEERSEMHMDIDARLAKIRQLLQRERRALLNRWDDSDPTGSVAELEREIAAAGGDALILALFLAEATIRKIGQWECLWFREAEVRRLMAEIYEQQGMPAKAAEERAKAEALDAERQRRIYAGLPLTES